MAVSSYINLIAFMVITILYYLFKPSLQIDQLDDIAAYNKTNSIYLAIYLLLIIISQFFVNVSIMSSTCGGKITDNLGPAAVFTVVPWLFIFGVMIMVLLVYPGFKSVFSDVIGYFYISSSANEIITKLLVNKEVSDTLKDQPFPGQEILEPSAPLMPLQDTEPSAPPLESIMNIAKESLSDSVEAPLMVDEFPIEEEPFEEKPFEEEPFEEEPVDKQRGGKKRMKKEGKHMKGGLKGGAPTRDQLQDAADLIVKICGNVSVLINQIVPENFKSYWNILTPLMKPKYTENPTPLDKAELDKLQVNLFESVVTRDNIGEAMWFLYTGILVTSLVQLKIATRGCAKSTQQMEADYKKFLAEEAEVKAKKQLSERGEYTIS